MIDPLLRPEGQELALAPWQARLSARQVRSLLRRHGLAPLRGRGQHFLVDPGVRRRIVAAAGLSPSDLVVEVGPGLGVLTEALACQARQVIGVEVDPGFVTLLRELLAAYPNVTIIHQDVLRLPVAGLIGADTPYKVVANLPYAITSPVLRHFLTSPRPPSLLVVMVQREVAQRIVAGPGQMGLLSVLVQFYGRPRILEKVPARCFYPAPRVDSALLRIEVYDQPPVPVPHAATFFSVVEAGFTHPRKQLPNALGPSYGLPPAQAARYLREAGLDPQRRAQTLSLEEWARLAAVLAPGA